MSSKTFFLKPKAEQDLEAIFEYSYQEFGLEKAYQYIKNIDKAFHTLAEAPGLARNYNHVRLGLKAFPVASHIIFFRLMANGITIVRVLHQSMDYQRHME
ncbi:type II toxin-antitoxin system RelE/ParE family toxin [Photorhabdus aegyptia]|uniref:type II toxin-antitoxin system RelE/ParE family toxin n=1 Tax=Photorhabdus aegyptia TaxID=2805098 RepID=UPI001E4AC320|nr:type II toxin-antitoxin system RelE/ParE family toxin [Photorhabdus aegyptia]MCC8458688.1 type II toxin-antitoxin system RelE/ParE family toxin [Photorhabdus aegyptia]